MDRENGGSTRREFLTAKTAARHHISSAVVFVIPVHKEIVASALADVPGVEVHAAYVSRIVITIEGPTMGMLGETLTHVSLMEGVISANMVFEHADEEQPS